MQYYHSPLVLLVYLVYFSLSAVLVQYKYFIPEKQGVSLQAPTGRKGTEFIWKWTSHDGRYTNTSIVTLQSNGVLCAEFEGDVFFKRKNV